MRNTYKIICKSLYTHEVWDRNNNTIFAGPDSESCREYIKEQKKEDEKYRKLNKSFEISGICREDLIEYIEEEQTLKLNNNQMKNIARKMGSYHQYTYWDDLTTILRELEIKQIEK